MEYIGCTSSSTRHLKVIHIHADFRFTSITKAFESDRIKNQLVLIGRKGLYENSNKGILSIEPNRKQIDKLILICNKADIVVIYNIPFVNSYIANRLSPSIILIWRFFGTELYNKIPNIIYSKLTKNVLGKDKPLRLLKKALLTTINGTVLHRVRWFASYKGEPQEAIRRIDYFLGVSNMEYQFLKEYWPHLPTFLQQPFSQYEKHSVGLDRKEDKVIIGNNRSAYNNHLEIIRIVSDSLYSNNYKFYMLFNYGKYSNYAKVVKEAAEKVKDISIIEEYLSLQEFRLLYANACAFILNGYRQMAMTNIFQALRSNVKLYMNRKNVIYKWLCEEGFLVFTIDDISHDIENSKMKLTISQAKYNANQWLVFTKKYNNTDFHNTLHNIIAYKNDCL